MPSSIRRPHRGAALSTGLAACTLALLLSLAAPASAGEVVATASQNPTGLITDHSPGSSVSAAWPDPVAPIAQALSTRIGIAATSLGASTQMPVHQAASGTARSDYQLWDPGTGAALDAGLAAGLTLSFHFRVTGDVHVPTVSLSTGSLNFDANLYSQVVDGYSSGVSAVYGPVPPFPSEGYGISGNAALLGPHDLGFDLLHVGSVGGLWTMGLSTSASNAATSSSLLRLDSVSLLSGAAPAQGLSIRLETGELIAVAVPEAPVWLLMLAGAACVTQLARRRSL